nr:hypothetical protein [uncultured bacterium]
MMAKHSCYSCGKAELTKDEVGLTKKLIDKRPINSIVLPVWQSILM